MTVVTRALGTPDEAKQDADSIQNIAETNIETVNVDISQNERSQQLPNQPSNTLSDELHLENSDISPNSDIAKNVPDECDDPVVVNREIPFPYSSLVLLEEKLANPRWLVPILPDQELEKVLNAALELCRTGDDVHSEPCQRFFKKSLGVCIEKIVCDDAIGNCKVNVYQCILSHCLRIIELCVLKLLDEDLQFLEYLATILNPSSKFNLANVMRLSDSIPLGCPYPDDYLYARPYPDQRSSRGWLVDMINKFGDLNGFELMLKRFQSDKNLTVQVVFALLRPFGPCVDLLTVYTIENYFIPIVDAIPDILEKLTDEQLKKEAKNETKNDNISTLIKICRRLVSKVPDLEEKQKEFEIFRLKMLLRMLQISSFNGKMNALSEINKLINDMNYFSQRHSNYDSEDWITSDLLAQWIKKNRVLKIVLSDSLHQPQYVEKLERILRFAIKQNAVTTDDLDTLWAAQSGKHEAIVKNVHDLMAKLAWDFSPEHLDYLFSRVQASSWSSTNQKQSEKLLQLLRRLGEDDKKGIVANKVLTLFWNLSHNEDVGPELLDQALISHVKILDYNCSQDRSAQKVVWIDKCVSELKENSNWVVPALKLIKDIFNLYENNNHQRGQLSYRHEVIERLELQYSFIFLVTENLVSYLDSVRELLKEDNDLDPTSYYPDNRYNHSQHIHERLNFLRYLLKEGQLRLGYTQAKLIWESLCENAPFMDDREECFRWFSKIVGDQSNIDVDSYKKFFESHVLQFDPALITENGLKCFERFFKLVNCKEDHCRSKRNDNSNNFELIGTDYLWRVLSNNSIAIAYRAIELLKEIYTNLGVRMAPSLSEFHNSHMTECIERLHILYDTVEVLCSRDENDNPSSPADNNNDDNNSAPTTEEDLLLIKSTINNECTKIVRVLKLLNELIYECDSNYRCKRRYLPLFRSYRGRDMHFIVKLNVSNRVVDEISLFSHTNETIDTLRQSIVKKLKSPYGPDTKIDIYANGQPLKRVHDEKAIHEIIFTKIIQIALRTERGSNSSSEEESFPEVDDIITRHGEDLLPGVMISRNPHIVQFCLQIADKGVELENDLLRELAMGVLKYAPPATYVLDKLNILFNASETDDATIAMEEMPTVENMFFCSSPSQVLYNLEVLYTMLMPCADPETDDELNFQCAFISSEHVTCCFDMINSDRFLADADMYTKRQAYTTALKICKLVLFTMAYYYHEYIDTSSKHSPDTPCLTDSTKFITRSLKQMLYSVSRQHPEYSVCTMANRITDIFIKKLIINNQSAQPSILNEHKWSYPGLDTIKNIMRIAWASGGGDIQILTDKCSNAEIHDSLLVNRPPILEDGLLAREALEVLTLSLAIHFSALETLCAEEDWLTFIIDIVLVCQNGSVRACASEQFNTIFTNSLNFTALMKCVCPLFDIVQTDIINDNGSNSQQYFQLLCHLLNYIYSCDKNIPDADAVLQSEVLWISNLRDKVKSEGEYVINDTLLEGHLSVTRELFSVTSNETKFYYGVDPSSSINLVKELMEDFIFPASTVLTRLKKSEDLLTEIVIPICRTSAALDAAYEILVMLCKECLPNLKLLTDSLTDMFYSGRDEPILEWDYYPPIGPRPINGFVGLKNASATCYMNAVLQQLYMIESIRSNLLTLEGAVADDEDLDEDKELEAKPDSEEYNINILKQIQTIFGHLTYSKLQYYIPRGLWRHFRVQGEPVNLREQHDAVEFFMNLVDCLDEALKALNCEQIMDKILGGVYSDQKLCKECPHRYWKEQPFSVLSVDVKNNNNLVYSLEQYVKGELLEGADAYRCDKCDKKVITVKRLCVKKLPPILAIQLKRFEFDYERNNAIKYNDYFEFPRELDMEPYTVAGLAKVEGELIDSDENGVSDDNSFTSCPANMDANASGQTNIRRKRCTKYVLTGIVVHSGQAAGGHYYSYIKCRMYDGNMRWFKFDDGEVTECRIDNDEEMRNQCFGGECTSERFNFRKQKRWWNAYALFYTRIDQQEENLVNEFRNLSVSLDSPGYTISKMPKAIEISIRKENLKFMHLRSQFCVEYFHFIKRISVCNNLSAVSYSGSQMTNEELSMRTSQLVARFLFYTAFRTKKVLRLSALDWWELLIHHLKLFRSVRMWFILHMLLDPPNRYCEYLLTPPSAEIKNTFNKIITHLAHMTLGDPSPDPELFPPGVRYNPTISVSDQLLIRALDLFNRDLGEYGRYVCNVFTLFHVYAQFGQLERTQLLKLNVPAVFMLIAIDEYPGPPIKYQPNDFSKCHSVVSTLVRCCDVRSKCFPSMAVCWSDYYGLKIMECDDEIPKVQPIDAVTEDVKPNPYGEYRPGEELLQIQPQVVELLYNRLTYIKKLIEDSQMCEDAIKLLQYICWENPIMSKKILIELLSYMSISHISDVKCIAEYIVCLLRMEDSWMAPRIVNTFNGMEGDKEGIFDIFLHHKMYQPKRAYYCVKILVVLCSRSNAAYSLLSSQPELKANAWHSIQWLKEQTILNELLPFQKTYMGSPEFNNYSNSFTTWASSQTDNYPLERSNSAKKILEKGLEIFPENDLPDVPFKIQTVRRDDDCSDDACDGEILHNEDLSDHHGNLSFSYPYQRCSDDIVPPIEDCDRYSPPQLQPSRPYYGPHHQLHQLSMQQSLELPQSVIDFTKLTASAPVQLDDIVLPVGVNENDDGTEASSSQEAASSNYDL